MPARLPCSTWRWWRRTILVWRTAGTWAWAWPSPGTWSRAATGRRSHRTKLRLLIGRQDALDVGVELATQFAVGVAGLGMKALEPLRVLPQHALERRPLLGRQAQLTGQAFGNGRGRGRRPLPNA